MSLALETHCNINYEYLDMLIEVARTLQKEFGKSVEQKEIKNDLRKLTSELNIHSSYFRSHNNYKILKFVENYLFKQGYYIFERITYYFNVEIIEKLLMKL
ncbi:35680_t:CDS:1 [Racocetra persica]|uniref:35680_t:CDS:1 n=1 Tax=Racocetra persica TaxID=160502 RepID=A0ACA9P8N5_9GLOM|nr:35680_t:CDS:1 [Racocetra persica]